MLIVAHIGDSINEYRLLGSRYFPEACPVCGGSRFRRHGQYPHNADDAGPVPIFRFRCNQRGCRQVFGVLPDLFVPEQSTPVAEQEAAVFSYAATVSTCSQAAKPAGVSTSTIWRWVDRICGIVDQWAAALQTWLSTAYAGSYVTVEVDDSLRLRWQSRRLRKPDKVRRLLLLERLPALVERCRKKLLTVVPAVAGAATCLGFCWCVLPKLFGITGT